jgi:RNA 2',3'-cyclic 3'-phosphodiesterase
MDSLRCFIAVDLSTDVRRAAGEIMRRLSAQHADVRWVAEDNLHLTVKFLGDTPTDKIEAVSQAVREAAAAAKPFTLRAAGVHPFPSRGRFNVVAVGVEGQEPLARLAADIDKRTAALGFEPEAREFRAHLTLGRVKGRKGIEGMLKAMEKFQAEALGTSEVKEIVLYQSELTRDGANYTAIIRAATGQG